MPPRTRSNPLALAVLACLYERPMHPYEIGQTLRSRAKHDSVRLNYGSLYSVVDALEARALITAQETVRHGRRPERTIYDITDAGCRELVEWESDLLAMPVQEFPQFQAALSFLPVLGPEEVLELLRTRLTAIEVRLAQDRGALVKAADYGLPRLFSLEAEYAIGQLDAEQRYVELLIKELETGSLDGLEVWRSFQEDLDNLRFIPPIDPNGDL
jgi:DNA-binding PadR family transcriptional regulator